MTLAMTGEQRAELETAVHTSRNVRHWKRYQAVLLRAAGTPVAMVAQTLGGSADRVSNWTPAWQAEGLAGVSEGQHPGAARRLDGSTARPSSGWKRCWRAIRRRREMRRPVGPCPCCAPSWRRMAGRRASGPSGGRSIGWGGAGSGPSSCSAGPIRPTRRTRGDRRASSRHSGRGRGGAGSGTRRPGGRSRPSVRSGPSAEPPPRSSSRAAPPAAWSTGP